MIWKKGIHIIIVESYYCNTYSGPDHDTFPTGFGAYTNTINALGYEFASRLSKTPGSVWNCLW